MKVKITIICSRNGFHPLLGDNDISMQDLWLSQWQLWYNAMQSVESQLIFQRNISLPSSRLKNTSSASYHLSCQFLAWLILLPWRWQRYVSPKHWFDFQQTIPKDNNLHSHQNSLKCYWIISHIKHKCFRNLCLLHQGWCEWPYMADVQISVSLWHPILLIQYAMTGQSQTVRSPIQFFEISSHHLTCSPRLSPTFCPPLLYMPSWHLSLWMLSNLPV
jgi:hypothetical protein